LFFVSLELIVGVRKLWVLKVPFLRTYELLGVICPGTGLARPFLVANNLNLIPKSQGQCQPIRLKNACGN
jgi:hypothetical protein